MLYWNFNIKLLQFKYVANASGSWVTTTVDSNDFGNSIALDSSDKVHISYSYHYDGCNEYIKYATNAVQPIPTPTPTVCMSESIIASPSRLNIKVNESGDVIVAVKGEDGCLAEGVAVNIKLTNSARK